MASTTPIKLTEWTSCGGCAAKWGGRRLSSLVEQIGNAPAGDDLLIGLAPFDDAAVFRISDDAALVSTTDFFPPLVDDPSDFGAIAAANACSDVFAMGGRVLLALNIAAFPENLSIEVVEEIFASAGQTVRDAGGVIAGGHTIRSEEPIFGLAVQGMVHPGAVFQKGGSRPGDVIVLSKPLGTGIVLAGGTTQQKARAIMGMRELNRRASVELCSFGTSVHAVTDVTGYGLFGHGFEMAERSHIVITFKEAAVPLYDGALQLATEGVRTGGDARNREYLNGRVRGADDTALGIIGYDPQTSGGLLAAVEPRTADHLVERGFTIVGYVTPGEPEIRVEP